MMTELAPTARATLLAGFFAAVNAGRMVGTLAGPALFGIGLLTLSLFAALLNLIALATLRIAVRVD
jgi:predicted lipid-binding transport protein (Tim44 family)